MANIFAFAEARGGELRKVALENVTAARKLADTTGGEVHALLVGGPGIASKAGQLGEHGADVVLVCEHEGFTQYNPEATTAIAAERIQEGGYRAAVFSTSAQGRDLAPRIAARLGVGLVTDVTAVELDGDKVVVKHPINIGKVMATVSMSGTPALVALRPNTYAPAQNAKAGRVEIVAPVGDPSSARVVVKELIQGGKGKLDLAEAPVIVAGGRG
ncbi:MAG: electron transfer flavoprotein subunit alpha/FixB family protein, partial [Gemmatimonadota bacterium]|nr:electron transfer flavoprotein subunit alpha/FixB family protein [Gemmatimonadota bacterium]